MNRWSWGGRRSRPETRSRSSTSGRVRAGGRVRTGGRLRRERVVDLGVAAEWRQAGEPGTWPAQRARGPLHAGGDEPGTGAASGDEPRGWGARLGMIRRRAVFGSSAGDSMRRISARNSCPTAQPENVAGWLNPELVSDSSTRKCRRVAEPGIGARRLNSELTPAGSTRNCHRWLNPEHCRRLNPKPPQEAHRERGFVELRYIRVDAPPPQLPRRAFPAGLRHSLSSRSSHRTPVTKPKARTIAQPQTTSGQRGPGKDPGPVAGSLRHRTRPPHDPKYRCGVPVACGQVTGDRSVLTRWWR